MFSKKIFGKYIRYTQTEDIWSILFMQYLIGKGVQTLKKKKNLKIIYVQVIGMLSKYTYINSFIRN